MEFSLGLVIVGAAAAGFVQGLSGFGFGLVSMSFWAWGLAPQTAAVLAAAGALVGQLLAALTVRRGFEPRLLAPFVVGGLCGLPLGIWLLPRLDVDLLRAFVGALLVTWCPMMLFSSRLPHLRWGGRAADALAGAIGGVMGPLGGFTGAIPTLWCTLRGYERERQRAVIQNFNLALLTVTMAAYAVTGTATRAHLPLISVVAVSLLVPALIGMRVYIGISALAFRNIVLVLLTISGVALLSAALPRLLQG